MKAQSHLPGLATTDAVFVPEVISDPRQKLQGYSLFVAIVPDEAEALRVTEIAAGIRQQCDLSGSARPASVIHLTLHELLGTLPYTPQAIVDAALAACARVVCQRFQVIFNRACGVRKPDRAEYSVFLRCDRDGDLAVARLRNELGRRLRSVGLHPKPSSTPHVTVLYPHELIDEQAIAPVQWNVTRFALILSHVGLTHHQRVGEWVLA